MRSYSMVAYAIVISCILIVTGSSPSRAIAVDEHTNNTQVVSSINYQRLQELYGITGTLSANEYGGNIQLPKRLGLQGDFTIGVFESVENAKSIWKSLQENAGRQTEALVINIDDTGGYVICIEEDPYGKRALYRVRLRTINVIITYDWQGVQDEAIRYADKLIRGIQGDQKLAPIGSSVNKPIVDVVIPAYIVKAGRSTIHYSTSTPAFIIPVSTIVDTLGNNERTSKIGIIGELKTARYGNFTVELQGKGVHKLTITFITTGFVVIKNVVMSEVVDQQQQGIDITEWMLPENAIFFSMTADGNKNISPNGTPEMMTVNIRSFLQFINQDDNVESIAKVLMWNQIANLLQSMYLPALDAVKVYKDIASPGNSCVGYIAFTVDDIHILAISRVGKRLLVYIEQPQNTGRDKAMSNLDRIIKNSARSQGIQVGDRSIILQSAIIHKQFQRYRALRLDGEYVPVIVDLIDVSYPNALSLNLPGYQ